MQRNVRVAAAPNPRDLKTIFSRFIDERQRPAFEPRRRGPILQAIRALAGAPAAMRNCSRGAMSGRSRPVNKSVPTRPSLLVRCRQSGFALIVVLWTLVLIAFIVSHLTATGRTEIRIATNIVANAVAQAAADGAIFEAVFNLSDPQPDQRWPVDGSVHELVIGNSRVRVRLEDEAWWINPNTASPALLEALLRVTGRDPEGARHLTSAIGEWVGSAPAPRPQNVVLADYRAAGLDYGPAGRATRNSRRARPSVGHDSGYFCRDAASSDAVWTSPAEPCQRRSVCRDGPSQRCDY